MNEIKIYLVGDSDYIAAASPAEAEKVLFEMIEGDGEVTEEFRKDYLDDTPPQELSVEEMNRLILFKEDDPYQRGWENSKMTFAEALQDMKDHNEPFPCHFATSEY